jgi:hypothetical protein
MGVKRTALGVVLSMELFGMAIGSIVVGAVDDRIGRSPTILACLVLMASAMFMAGNTHGLSSLSAYRLITGLGIRGGQTHQRVRNANAGHDFVRARPQQPKPIFIRRCDRRS